MADATPTIRELFDILSPLAADWYDLGIELDMPTGTLDVIQTDRPSAKLRLTTMLEKWQAKYPEKGWSDIVHVLEKKDQNKIAQQVKAKYGGGTVAGSGTSTGSSSVTASHSSATASHSSEGIICMGVIIRIADLNDPQYVKDTIGMMYSKLS